MCLWFADADIFYIYKVCRSGCVMTTTSISLHAREMTHKSTEKSSLQCAGLALVLHKKYSDSHSKHTKPNAF